MKVIHSVRFSMTTVRYITPFYIYGVPGSELSRPLEPALEELNAREREIIFHMFSMNGCMAFISLWQIFDESPDGRKIKQNVKGVIFDRYALLYFLYICYSIISEKNCKRFWRDN